MDGHSSKGKTRRKFLKGLGAATAGIPLVGTFSQGKPSDQPLATNRNPLRDIILTVNGRVHSLEVEPRRTLAEVLREDLGLTGTKISCSRATCGACTVIMEGRAIFACHTLAVEANGRSIATIEGLANGQQLHPIQEAFIQHDAYQCGFCTSGMIMALKAALDRNPDMTRDQIRYAIAGNICRCGAYEHILDAALAAATRMRAKS